MVGYSISYVCSLVILIGLDYLWLGVLIQSHIQKRLGNLMREPMLFGPALLFYVLYTGAILFFATQPAVNKQSRLIAAGYGALLGFTAYMTYDLTNWATLKNRPVSMILPDIIWGTFVTAFIAVVGYLIKRYV